MIVACPFCRTRFLVAASLFAGGPRQMLCAKCKHSWRAEAPPVDTMPDSDGITAMIDATPDSTSHAPPKAPVDEAETIMPPAVKRALKIGLAGAAAVFVAWFILNRQNIAENFGFLEPFYDTIGLHIYHSGEGLSIRSVRSELVYEDGIMKLSVEGKIFNTTNKTQQIPPFRASAVGADGQAMQDWQIDAPAAKVAPGEDVPFHSSINAPKGSVADIILNFIEIKPDASQ